MQIQHLQQIHLIAPIHWVSVCLRMLWMNWPCCPILRDASLAAASHFPQHLQRQFFNFSLLFPMLSFAFSIFKLGVCHFQFSFCTLFWPLAFFIWKSHFCLLFSLSLSSRSPCLDFRQYSLRFWVLICMPQMASERILVCLLPYWQTGISISSSAANNWICYKPCYFSMHTLFALQLMHTIPLTAFRAYPLACWQQNVLVSSNSICI